MTQTQAGTYFHDQSTGKSYYRAPDGKTTEVNREGQKRKNPNSPKMPSKKELGDGVLGMLMVAIGFALVLCWGMNVEPLVSYFDQPLIERVGSFLDLGGLASTAFAIWVWRIFGGIGLIWFCIKLRKDSFLFWVGALLLLIAVVIGPAIFKDSADLVWGIVVWFVIQGFELMPTLKGNRATDAHRTARACAYLAEFYFQFWMYPPYEVSGGIYEVFKAIMANGGINLQLVQVANIVLSLIAIFSFEGAYWLFSEAKRQTWQ